MIHEIRQTIPEQTKDKWLMKETLLEKITEKYRNNFRKKINKRKLERLKINPRIQTAIKLYRKILQLKTFQKKFTTTQLTITTNTNKLILKKINKPNHIILHNN